MNPDIIGYILILVFAIAITIINDRSNEHLKYSSFFISVSSLI